MPEFTYADRLVLGQEQSLWNVVEILQKESDVDNAFGEKINDLYERAKEIAKELQEYNDQFESED